MRLTRRVKTLLALPLGIGALVGAVLLLTGQPYPAASTRPPAPSSPQEFRVAPGTPASPTERTVVMLLFDGLAPAFLDAQETPALNRLRREGSWTRHMVPPFPSISLTGGFTISTGCWPSHHGIVSNRFFDPQRGFYDHSKDADWVTGCEELHEAAERQGVPTATLGWYGEVSSTRGKLARIVVYTPPGETYPTDTQRGEEVLKLLRLPANERPQLILAYFRGPDGIAHVRGMQSAEARAAVAETDRIVGAVRDTIEAVGLRDHAVLIVTTDHGTTPISRPSNVNVEYLLRMHGIAARMVASGTTAFIYLNEGTSADEAARELSGYPEFDVIIPDLQPSWSHVGTGPRVGDLIVSAKPGYVMEDRGEWPWSARWRAWTGPMLLDSSRSAQASHGYPPETAGMHGIFYAWGDGIKKNNEVERMQAIDIHPTVTRLLGIAPGRSVDGQAASGFFSAGR